MLDRRTLLNCAGKTLVCAMLEPWRAPAGGAPLLTLSFSAIKPVHLPSDFIGLGYEISSIATPGLLSGFNEVYVRLVKALGPDGVIRVGGIVADYTRYQELGEARTDSKNTVITRKIIEQFNSFLVHVGWKAIWSLNFAQGTVGDAVIEAQSVASGLGSRLLAFELGNEVENYSRGDKPFRTAPYSYDRYRLEYDAWRSKIVEAVPGAHFAAPDTAASVEWVERMALDAKGDVQLLTTHYYRGGQKEGTADQLLHPDSRLKDVTERLRAASGKSSIPWRMCETNSFFGGGRPGVSDTFVGTLWTLDFMLFLAANGCAGVNIETGVNQLGFISSYSPIGQDERGHPRVGAPYYGMLAFAIAVRGCDKIASLTPNSSENISAYLLGKNEKNLSAVVINRTDHDLDVSLPELHLSHVEAMRLVAPSIDSVKEITLAGSEVGADGTWNVKRVEQIRGKNFALPRMSAVILRSQR